MASITTAQREEAEALIYKVFDTMDKTHTNSDYYRKLFANMSDEQFYNFCKRRLPFRYHEEVFKNEPKMYDIIDAFKVLNKPLLEHVKMPHVYVNKDGVPVESKECLVIYIHLKRMKQFLTKKNSTAINIDKRDMKTGLLTSDDKGGKETDREFESLATMGLEYTMDEFARPKADAMGAMAQMSNTIMSKGYVSEKDINVAKDDSIGKNLLNVYLIGANIHSNLVDIDYMTPYTAKNKQQKIERV
jgi:hypothetical protein